jgi:hypothetical protein
VSFSAPGVYTLELSAADGVHAVAYDAAVFTVTNDFSVSGAADGSDINLTWSGGAAPFVVQRADSFPANSWSDILTTSVQNASFPLTNKTGFFRILSQ